jgi:hypothetical protein
MVRRPSAQVVRRGFQTAGIILLPGVPVKYFIH